MIAALTRFRSATLPIAFAASVAVHVSTLAALIGVDAGPRATPSPDIASQPPPLQARLVAVPPPVAPVVSTVSPVVQPAVAPAATSPEEVPAERRIARPSPGAASGERSAVGWKPRIVVNDRVPRARFGDALDGDTLAAFLTEVDAPVGLPERFDVTYPSAALTGRKEGSVLVWAVITDQGTVDSVHVVEGDPEFAAAVEEALGRTRFAPARNLGHAVPFYVTLEFEFRLDATAGTVAAKRTANAAR